MKPAPAHSPILRFMVSHLFIKPMLRLMPQRGNQAIPLIEGF